MTFRGIKDPIIQPKLGSMTLITNVVEHNGKYGVWALCHCGAFVFVPTFAWRDGPRPEQCRPCWKKKRPNTMAKVPRTTPLPDYAYGMKGR